MASHSLTLPSTQSQIPSQNSPFKKCSLKHGQVSIRPISATVSEEPRSSSLISKKYIKVSIESPPKSAQPTKLPIRKIPGNYGIPLISPWKDRQDYFYNQGRDEYLKSRIRKYNSTVFRTNMPPGPFISANPNVVVLLDGKSFPILFDVTKVEKKDLFTGTYMPSTELTGGYRVLSYLDPTEPNHGKLKRLIMFLLKSRRERVIPEFRASYAELFQDIENGLATKGKSEFGGANEQAAFNFLARSLFGANPLETDLGADGPELIGKWVLFQLSPLLVLGLPRLFEDIFLHTFRLPPFLVKKDYRRLYDFFFQSSAGVLDEAERIGLSREEACHNILFATCFNSFGGMKIFFPNMLKWIGRGGVKLHNQLATEIRSVIRSNGGQITMDAMERMPLMKSVVYESLRIEPPVPLQYGRARQDLVIESHDASFEVKAGEMLFGYQPFATKDPKIFDRPEEFMPGRFMGENGEKLLKHVVWSNGPETQSPAIGNKQCAGKDFVVLVSRLLVMELFLRYDSFDIEVKKSPLGAAVTITSLKRASF